MHPLLCCVVATLHNDKDDYNVNWYEVDRDPDKDFRIAARELLSYFGS